MDKEARIMKEFLQFLKEKQLFAIYCSIYNIIYIYIYIYKYKL